MPASTNWATFNRARKTGITKTTEALEALFIEKDPNLVNELRKARALDGLKDPFLSALKDRGLSQLELDHIRDWDDDQKEDVRQAFVDAIDADLTMRFRWKLHDGSVEDTIVEYGPGHIDIIFYSPWSKVRPVAADDVVVDV